VWCICMYMYVQRSVSTLSYLHERGGDTLCGVYVCICMYNGRFLRYRICMNVVERAPREFMYVCMYVIISA
jgi:hypothetical protein